MINDRIFESFKGIAPKLNLMAPTTDTRPFYELMSGGIIWTDEKPPFKTNMHELGSLRMIWNYRTSLFLEKPRKEFEELWIMAHQVAPKWPGFLSERQIVTPEILNLIPKNRKTA